MGLMGTRTLATQARTRVAGEGKALPLTAAVVRAGVLAGTPGRTLAATAGKVRVPGVAPVDSTRVDLVGLVGLVDLVGQAVVASPARMRA